MSESGEKCVSHVPGAQSDAFKCPSLESHEIEKSCWNHKIF